LAAKKEGKKAFKHIGSNFSRWSIFQMPLEDGMLELYFYPNPPLTILQLSIKHVEDLGFQTLKLLFNGDGREIVFKHPPV
jgi:hypothetical protein